MHIENEVLGNLIAKMAKHVDRRIKFRRIQHMSATTGAVGGQRRAEEVQPAAPRAFARMLGQM